MKRLLALLLAILLCFSFCGCGNMSMGIGNYEFNKAHIEFGKYSQCVEVTKWYDSEGTGIEVKTPDGALFLSEGTYMLIEDDCPICDNHN